MDKLEDLKQNIAAYGKLCVAYSGGTDSSFLVHVAYQVLGNNALAVLIDSPVLARRDKTAAIEIIETLGIPYEIVEENPFESVDFVKNNKMRCYFCKQNNYTLILEAARRHGINFMADGQNADDAMSPHRPGLKAGREMGVVSPLADCGLTKDEVRKYSRLLNITTWNKPANACLSSRIPYGTEITRERLAAVEIIETLGVPYEIVEENPFESVDFVKNNKMRCYFCKQNNYTLILEAAQRHGIKFMADGQNADDAMSPHRPGLKAGREIGVVSPLAECGLTKDEVRKYSRLLNITTWNKPANALFPKT
jgi:uncharacterized protein